MKRSRLLILLLTIAFLPVMAQKKHELGKAPRSACKDFHALAHALTDSLPNDSLKVRSIFLWEANHISYGGGATEPNDILRARSAVCLGYSILFDSLCRVAGIEAEIVPGYVYMPWYEPEDTIYLARHAWNAVKIDGEWKLIDVTWCRGKLELKEQPLKRWLCRKFHFPYVPVYKYKMEITDRYYLIDPALMVLDHLPTTPAWQLLDCSVPMDSFQRSPHSVEHFLASPVFCKNGNDSIEKITAEPEYKHLLISGRQGFAFNKRDHYVIGYGAEVHTGYYWNQAINPDFFWQTRLLYCDSTLGMIDTCMKYYIKDMRDMRNERDYFLRRNRRMNVRVNNETRPMYRKQMRQIPAVRREWFRTYTLVFELRNENRRLRRESRHFNHKQVKLSRPGNPQPGAEKQRQRLEDMYTTNSDSVAAHEERMDLASYYRYAWEVVYQDTLVSQKKRFLQIMVYDMRAVLFYKNIGKTCLDTEVYSQKNQCLLEQHEFDSVQLLLRKPGKWRIDSTAKVYYKEAATAKQLLRKNMGLLRQLARMEQGSIDEKAEAGLVRTRFVSINDSLIAYNKQRISDLKHYRKSMKKLGALHRTLKRNFHDELRGEVLRFGGTSQFFRYYYRQMADVMQGTIRTVRKAKGGMRRYRNSLRMEIRRRERDHQKAHRYEQNKYRKEQQKLSQEKK